MAAQDEAILDSFLAPPATPASTPEDEKLVSDFGHDSTVEDSRKAIAADMAGHTNLDHDTLVQLYQHANTQSPREKLGSALGAIRDFSYNAQKEALTHPLRAAGEAYDFVKPAITKAGEAVKEFTGIGDTLDEQQARLNSSIGSGDVSAASGLTDFAARVIPTASNIATGVANVIHPSTAYDLDAYNHVLQRATEQGVEDKHELAKRLGGDPEGALAKASEFGGWSLLPIGVEAKLSPLIAKGVETGVEQGVKRTGQVVAGAAKAGKSAAVPALAAVELAHGSPWSALATLATKFVPEGQGFWGNLAKIRHAAVEAPFEYIQQAGNIAAQAKDGQTLIETMVGANEAEINRQAQRLDKLRTQFPDETAPAFENDALSGGRLNTSKELGGRAKEARQIEETILNKQSRIDTLNRYKGINQILSDGLKFGLNAGANAGVAGGAMAAFAGTSAPPGQESQAAVEGFKTGLALGAPGAISAGLHAPELLGKDALIKGDVRPTTHPAEPLHQENMANLPQGVQDYVNKASGLSTLNNSKPVIVLKPDQLVSTLRDVEGVNVKEAPHGFEGKDAIYANADTLASGSIPHELIHGTGLDEHPEVVKAVDAMVKNPAYSKQLQGALDQYKTDLQRSIPGYEGLTPENRTKEIIAALGADVLKDIPPEALYGGRGGRQLISKFLNDKFGKKGTGSTSQFGFPVTPEMKSAMTDALFELGKRAEQGPTRPVASSQQDSATTTPPAQQNAPTGPTAAQNPTIVAPSAGIPNLTPDIVAGLKKKGFTDEQIASLDPNSVSVKGPGIPEVSKDTGGGFTKSDIPAVTVPSKFPEVASQEAVQHGEFPQSGYTAQSGVPAIDAGYTYLTPEGQAWWEKADQLRSDYRATEPHSPERAAARKAFNDHQEQVYGKGNKFSRIDGNGNPQSATSLSLSENTEGGRVGQSPESSPNDPSQASSIPEVTATAVSEPPSSIPSVAGEQGGVPASQVADISSPVVPEGYEVIGKAPEGSYARQQGFRPGGWRDHITPAEVDAVTKEIRAEANSIENPTAKQASDFSVRFANAAREAYNRKKAQSEQGTTPETIQGKLQEANASVADKMARAKSPEKRQEIARKARLGALKSLLGESDTGLRPSTDEATGEVSYKGHVDPKNPVHKAILDQFGYTPEQVQTILDLQKAQGQSVYLRDYNSAAQEGFAEGGAEFTGAKRGEEYKASPTGKAGERKGEVSKQDKPFTPLGTVLTDKGINVFGFDHDKFLSNVRAILDAAHEQGIETGYEGLKGSKLDDEIAADFRAVSANHAAGVDKTGQTKLQTFPDVAKPRSDAPPQLVDPNRANVINMAMANEGAKPPGEARGKTDLAQAKFAKALDKSKQALGIADLNAGFRTPEGEVNPLRDQLNKNGFDSKATLKPAFSNVRPDLIEGGVHPAPGEGKSVHAHGFDIPASELAHEGFPKSDFTAAGFLPSSHPDAIENAATKFEDGKIFTGRVHAIANNKAIDEGYDPYGKEATEGFMTKTGRFLDRKEAIKHAESINQLPRDLVHDQETDASQVGKPITDLHTGILEQHAGEGRFLPAQSPLGFYSHLEKTAEDKIPNKASAEQILATLKSNGVKPDELKWTDTDKFLADKKAAGEPVTKEQLLAHIRENQVDVREVVKGTPVDSAMSSRIDELHAIRATRRFTPEESKEYNRLQGEIGKPLDSPTKFAQYQLPGAEPGSYREANLVASKIEDWKGFPDAHKYSGGDEDLKRIAHVRYNDRTGPNGERILHLEEIQSDRHQKGRKEGYRGGDLPNGFTIEENPDFNKYAGEAKFLIRNKEGDIIASGGSREGAIDAMPGGNVPDAPFKTTWPALALKRMIRFASENGYDAITWTNGETQAARYDLSKHIDEVVWNKTRSGLIAYDHKGEAVISKNGVDESNLADFIGKDVAQKLINEGRQPKSTVRGAEDQEVYRLKGAGLKVGGEGMKGFYDKILPSVANELGKKFGARVSETNLVRGEESRPLNQILKEDYGTDWGSATAEQREKAIAQRDSAKRLESLRKELADVTEEANRQYWNFTRSANGRPVDAKLTARREELRDQIAKELSNRGGPTVHQLPITDAMRKSVTEQGQPLFLPAAEAGASPNERADAAKQWAEKGTDSPYFKRWSKNLPQSSTEKPLPRSGAIIRAFHGTPDASFSIFNEGAHFTENEDYANRYQGESASSINVRAKSAKNPQTIGVFIKTEKPFDTRNSQERSVYERQFLNKYGNGTPLSERGLPDWTDSRDLLEWLDEKGLPYDSIVLDEGGTPEGGWRGTSIVPRRPEQIKSATGNTGTFDPHNPDIRFLPATDPANPKNLAAAALRLNNGDLVYAKDLDTPHMLLMTQGDRKYGREVFDRLLRGSVSGWVDARGNFLDRAQSKKRAIETGQASEDALDAEDKKHFGAKMPDLESLSFAKARHKSGIPDLRK